MKMRESERETQNKNDHNIFATVWKRERVYIDEEAYK